MTANKKTRRYNNIIILMFSRDGSAGSPRERENKSRTARVGNYDDGTRLHTDVVDQYYYYNGPIQRGRYRR